MFYISRKAKISCKHICKAFHLWLLIEVFHTKDTLHQVIVFNKRISVLYILSISLVRKVIHCVLDPTLIHLFFLSLELIRKDIKIGVPNCRILGISNDCHYVNSLCFCSGNKLPPPPNNLFFFLGRCIDCIRTSPLSPTLPIIGSIFIA